jgi:hypothetical protein
MIRVSGRPSPGSGGGAASGTLADRARKINKHEKEDRGKPTAGRKRRASYGCFSLFFGFVLAGLSLAALAAAAATSSLSRVSRSAVRASVRRRAQ